MKVIAIVLACLMLAACGGGSSPPETRTLTIMLDASGSAPLLAANAEDRAIFARLAGERAAAMVAGLNLGDTVAVQYVGERSLANLKTLREPITRQARAPQMAQAIAEIIEGAAARGTAGQPWTELTRALSVGEFACASGGDILLVSDSIESTPTFDAKALLAGTLPLPAPRPNMLAGCRITMFGIGITGRGPLPQAQTDTLRAAWERWAGDAGAQITFVELQ